jgi:hypothetical protein
VYGSLASASSLESSSTAGASGDLTLDANARYTIRVNDVLRRDVGGGCSYTVQTVGQVQRLPGALFQPDVAISSSLDCPVNRGARHTNESRLGGPPLTADQLVAALVARGAQLTERNGQLCRIEPRFELIRGSMLHATDARESCGAARGGGPTVAVSPRVGGGAADDTLQGHGHHPPSPTAQPR